MKIYHTFTSYHPPALVSTDVCVFCNKTSHEIFYLLNKDDRNLYDYRWQDRHNRQEEILFLSQKCPCPNGLTEEEYIIKNIIE